ncbi:hypothetical protein [Methylobacterium ajmalii]|uniref:hypothetical protein n=1 Tax=Methylobacterium ajmalii TaxID=2738439 RepID=UPI00190D617A|nr:hypothetical protein [Methylobacterium ajmalii]MBK3397764.1 hypothetical protein [Methylobacterium ajmalii]MBK3408465.1 hypothetical protein [Methylobacterium ajmalii]MBK3424134.1 hypothetical protein [Methylobacterium ajmalii]MBZ6416611.1 hypothetical protein [Methylobacterium sp.]
MVDDFAQAVIAAREQAAEARRVPEFKGRLAAEDEERHWGLLASGCAGCAARLVLVTHLRFADHPLLAEAIALREELQRHFERAHARHTELRRGAVRLSLR